ncbi:MAG TPA: PEGA domain-containing protein [Polyangiaceae bacterium]
MNFPKSRLEARQRRRLALGSRGLALLVGLHVAVPHPALATDAQADPANSAEQRRTLAKAKYAEGVEAYRGARYADAVRLFLEADAISPSAALSYNIARAYEKLADDAQTLRWYRNYLRLNPHAQNAIEVQGYVRSLSEALAKVGIQQLTVLTSPPGATIAIDGTPLGVSPLTVELRPGSHEAWLSLRGFSDNNSNFVLPQATPIDLSIALQPTPNESRSPGDASPEARRRFGIAPYLTLGAAALCLSSAGIFELSRRSAQNSARDEQVQLDYERDIDAMNSRQTTARVLLGVGSVLAVTGVGLLVFNTKLGPESRARVAGVPGGATFSLERRF